MLQDSSDEIVHRGEDEKYGDSYDVYKDGSCRCKWPIYNEDVLEMLRGQRKTGECTDVEVKGVELPCHRAMLVSIPYFKTMLSSKFADSTAKVIELQGFDPIALSKIIDFVYTGGITISKDDVEDILSAAHMLQFDRILRYCEEFIKGELHDSPSISVSVMHLADLYGLSDLKRRARNDALFYFFEECQNEEFLSLSKTELLDLLADDNLRVATEDDVAHFVIRWLDHDLESRKEALFQILQEIRLSCVRVSVLETLESHPAVQASPECLAEVRAAKEKHLTDTGTGGANAELDWAEDRYRSGFSDDLAIIVGGWKAIRRYDEDNDDDKDSPDMIPRPQRGIIGIDPDHSQCYHITDLPTPQPATPVCGYMSVTRAGHRLYVTGGREQPLVGQAPHTAPSRQAWQYDFPTDTWTEFSDMPRGRAEHLSVAVDNKLFVIGGDTECAEETTMLNMDCYDLEEGVWTEMPSTKLQDKFSKLTVTTHGSNIVLAGLSIGFAPGDRGYDEYFEIPLVYAFDVKTAHWVHTPSIQVPDSVEPAIPSLLEGKDEKTQVVAVDEKLYFRIPGRNGSNLHAYDVTERSLTTEDMDEHEQFLTPNVVVPKRPDHAEYYADGQIGITDGIWVEYFDLAKYVGSGHGVRGWVHLPFGLFGHSFLGTKKSSVGWYCRDLEKLQNSDAHDGVGLDSEVSLV